MESSSPTKEFDRFDECKKDCFLVIGNTTRDDFLVVLEVEERKQFLEQMTICGKRKEYQPVIANEIADVRNTKKICSHLVSLRS